MKLVKENKKIIVQVVFLLVLLVLTFYYLLKGQELEEIWNTVKSADKGYLVIGIVLVIVFVCSESVIIYYMMHSLGKKIPFHNCIKYSFIGFFFSCITPSASGGQPAQIYYMKKDEVDIPVSTLVLMIVTITYKFVLVLVGIFLLVFCRTMIDHYLQDTKMWFVFGILLNIGTVLLMYILIFWPKLTKKLVQAGLGLIEKCRVLKHKEERNLKIAKSMDKYKESAYFFRNNKVVVFNVLLISIFQRFCLFFSTYIVYRAFGLEGVSAFDIVILQATISIAVDMLPLPGGVGMSEALFLAIFQPIFGAGLVLSGMLLSRGISYYALLIISALVTVYAHLSITAMAAKRARLKKREKDAYVDRIL